MTTPPTDQQLDEIAKAVAAYQQHPDIGFACCTAHPVADAGAALVAEVRRQRTELAAEQRRHGDTIDDRDRAQDAADKLAYAVAPENVIGEHTADNSPWENALDLITPMAEVDRLRTELAAVHAFLDEQERAARLFELPTPAWVEAMRAASVPPAAPLSASHTSSVSESAQSPTGAPEGALRPSLSVGASEICGKCKKPFDLADTSRDGHNRFYLTPYCRRCVDACHDTEIADHRCVICA